MIFVYNLFCSKEMVWYCLWDLTSLTTEIVRGCSISSRDEHPVYTLQDLCPDEVFTTKFISCFYYLESH